VNPGVAAGNIHTGRLLAAFILVRLVVSTAFRMVFPFLPALARGLGVSVEAMAVAVSARSALGLLGPLLGAFADMRGRKQALTWGLAIFGISLAIVGIWPAYPVFFLGLVISGGATVVVDSSVHAYLGDAIPYRQRGRAAAIVELGWSLAFVIGIPLVGWSMARSGWNAPFIWLGLAGLLAGGVIGLVVPRTLPASGSWLELRSGLHAILSPAPLLGLLLALLATLGNSVVSIVFGIWMEDSFGLQLEQLGAASSVIGLAGIAGVGCAVLFTDRLGKRQAVGLGLLVNSLICLGLPFMGSRLWGALAALFIFYMSFEFTLTSLLPLMTSLSTLARGAFMAAVLAAFSLGDSLGALVGPALILRNGMAANALVTVGINLCGLFLLAAFVRPVEISEKVI
jgi:predicted MFS family arabinose efflux permease